MEASRQFLLRLSWPCVDLSHTKLCPFHFVSGQIGRHCWAARLRAAGVRGRPSYDHPRLRRWHWRVRPATGMPQRPPFCRRWPPTGRIGPCPAQPTLLPYSIWERVLGSFGGYAMTSNTRRPPRASQEGNLGFPCSHRQRAPAQSMTSGPWVIIFLCEASVEILP